MDDARSLRRQTSRRRLKALPCDIFLGAHGAYFNMLAKLDRAKSSAGESVWIDPAGYRAAVAERQQAFATELKRQQDTPSAAKPAEASPQPHRSPA